MCLCGGVGVLYACVCMCVCVCVCVLGVAGKVTQDGLLATLIALIILLALCICF